MEHELYEIFRRTYQDIEDFGFLGDETTPVVLDHKPKSHIMHAIIHAHLDGVCIKNRFGAFCS